jgi:hypothetical protein
MPECLAFERPVAEFAMFMKEDCAFEFVRCLALVEAGLAAPAQCRAREPFDHEKRSPDAAEFPKSLGQCLSFGDAESFFKIVEGTTARVVIDAAR